MKCPFCGEEMEKGIIASPEPINWLKEEHFINQPNKDKGEFMLARGSMGKRTTVEAWACKSCRKVIISY